MSDAPFPAPPPRLLPDALKTLRLRPVAKRVARLEALLVLAAVGLDAPKGKR